MNIFALDSDPFISGQQNCDIHCNRMFLEMVQCLTNCFPLQILPEMPLTKDGNIRKYSHFNHPSAKWIRENQSNLQWTINYTAQLEFERLYRGMKPHFSSAAFAWIVDNTHQMSYIPEGELTPIPPAISANKNCRQISNFSEKHFTEQYRLYYIFDKPFARWSVRDTPEWFIEMKENYNMPK